MQSLLPEELVRLAVLYPSAFVGDPARSIQLDLSFRMQTFFSELPFSSMCWKAKAVPYFSHSFTRLNSHSLSPVQGSGLGYIPGKCNSLNTKNNILMVSSSGCPWLSKVKNQARLHLRITSGSSFFTVGLSLPSGRKLVWFFQL